MVGRKGVQAQIQLPKNTHEIISLHQRRQRLHPQIPSEAEAPNAFDSWFTNLMKAVELH